MLPVLEFCQVTFLLTCILTASFLIQTSCLFVELTDGKDSTCIVHLMICKPQHQALRHVFGDLQAQALYQKHFRRVEFCSTGGHDLQL